MTRIRTGNNRRRAKALKAGGLYTLARQLPAALRWAEYLASPMVADLNKYFARNPDALKSVCIGSPNE